MSTMIKKISSQNDVVCPSVSVLHLWLKNIDALVHGRAKYSQSERDREKELERHHVAAKEDRCP